MTAAELAEMITLLERAAVYTANPAWQRSFSEAAHRGRLLAALSSPSLSSPSLSLDPEPTRCMGGGTMHREQMSTLYPNVA